MAQFIEWLTQNQSRLPVAAQKQVQKAAQASTALGVNPKTGKRLPAKPKVSSTKNPTKPIYPIKATPVPLNPFLQSIQRDPFVNLRSVTNNPQNLTKPIYPKGRPLPIIKGIGPQSSSVGLISAIGTPVQVAKNQSFIDQLTPEARKTYARINAPRKAVQRTASGKQVFSVGEGMNKAQTQAAYQNIKSYTQNPFRTGLERKILRGGEIAGQITNQVVKLATRLPRADNPIEGMKVWGNLGKDIAQGTVREGVTFGWSGADAILNPLKAPQREVTIPKPLQPLFGTDKLKTYQTEYNEDFFNDIIEGRRSMFDALEPFVRVPLAGVDVATALSVGSKAVISGVKVNDEAIAASIKKMGLTDTSEASQKEAYRRLAKELHPDLGGSSQSFSELNQANSILNQARRDGTLVNEPGRILRGIRSLAEKGLMNADEALKTGRASKATPYLGVKGYLPEQAGTYPDNFMQPRQRDFGLSIRPINAKPLSKLDNIKSSTDDILNKADFAEAKKYNNINKFVSDQYTSKAGLTPQRRMELRNIWYKAHQESDEEIGNKILEITKKSNALHNEKITIGKANQPIIQEAKRSLGIDVSEFNHEVDAFGFKHAIKRHSSGPMALTDEDIKSIPDIIKHPDKVIYSGKNKRGLDVFRYMKRHNGTTHYLEEVRSGRKTLDLNTMYKTKTPLGGGRFTKNANLSTSVSKETPATLAGVNVNNDNIISTGKSNNNLTDEQVDTMRLAVKKKIGKLKSDKEITLNRIEEIKKNDESAYSIAAYDDAEGEVLNIGDVQSRAIKSAIRNSPYFKKEGSELYDWSGMAIMQKGKEYRFATSEEHKRDLIDRGYSYYDTIEGIADVAERDPEYMIEKLTEEILEGRKESTEAKIHNYLINENKEYLALNNRIKEITKELKQFRQKYGNINKEVKQRKTEKAKVRAVRKRDEARANKKRGFSTQEARDLSKEEKKFEKELGIDQEPTIGEQLYGADDPVEVVKDMNKGSMKSIGEDVKARQADFEKMLKSNDTTIHEVVNDYKKTKNVIERVTGAFQGDPKKKLLNKVFINHNRNQAVARAKAQKQVNDMKAILKDAGVKDNLDTIHTHEEGKQYKGREVVDKFFKDVLDKSNLTNKYPIEGKKNYIPHVYEETPEEVACAISKHLKKQGLSDVQIQDYLNGRNLSPELAKTLKLNPFFTKARSFDTYLQAKRAGLTPKYETISQLAGHWVEQEGKARANRILIDDLSKNGLITSVPDYGMMPVMLPGQEGIYFARPKTAAVINDIFRNEEGLNITQKVVKGAGQISAGVQQMVLAGGLPKSVFNAFSFGHIVKSLTTATGNLALGKPCQAYTHLKAVATFLRSNSNKATIKWFEKRVDNGIIYKMAEQGVDVTNYIGNYRETNRGLKGWFNKDVKKIRNAEGVWGKLGAAKDAGEIAYTRTFDEKTFRSFLPMQMTSLFEDTYNAGLRKGLSEQRAAQLAGEVTKNFGGISETVRGKTTEDLIRALFLAPKFRESLLNTYWNVLEGVIDPRNWRNSAYSQNRALLAGMVITLAGMDVLNQKFSGHHIWENPVGKELELMITTAGGKIYYVPFMPSQTAVVRNSLGTVWATAKGEYDVAIQKFGSFFSIPVKLVTDVVSNKDYFGNEIWDKNDPPEKQRKDIATYIGLGTTHPYIKALNNLNKRIQATTDPIYSKYLEITDLMAQGKKDEADRLINSLSKEEKNAYYKLKGLKLKPDLQILIEALELPVRFSDLGKVKAGEFYRKRDEMIKAIKATPEEDRQEKIQEFITKEAPENRQGVLYSLRQEGIDVTGVSTSEAIIKMKPVYEEVQRMVKEGKQVEAQQRVDSMTDEEYEQYKKVKSSVNANYTKQFKNKLSYNPADSVIYLRSLPKEQQDRILKNMSDEEYSIYHAAAIAVGK